MRVYVLTLEESLVGVVIFGVLFYLCNRKKINRKIALYFKLKKWDKEAKSSHAK